MWKLTFRDTRKSTGPNIQGKGKGGGKYVKSRTRLVERENPHPNLPPEKGKEPFERGAEGGP
ncbi:hypothetical protein GCM10027046_03570 [Uliginosibacterium flavum]